jgi:hypothetical protein
MTAHSPETAEAADVRDTTTVSDDAVSLDDILTEFLADQEGGEEEAATDAEGDEPEAEDGDTEDEQDDEPEAPAIEPPASLTADEKAAFAQLPPEAQRLMNDVEARRNTQVQQATTKAAEAQREAQASAAQAAAATKADYAQRFAAFASVYAPQAPDPRLAEVNPQAYIAQEAQYRAASAQHNDIVQQIQAMKAEADQHFQAQEAEWTQAQIAELSKVAEWANPETRPAFYARLSPVGEALGYSAEDMAQAGAADILALKTAADWKDKAAKWDAAQARQMQRVRDAKSAKPGSQVGRGDRATTNRMKAEQGLSRGRDADLNAYLSTII